VGDDAGSAVINGCTIDPLWRPGCTNKPGSSGNRQEPFVRSPAASDHRRPTPTGSPPYEPTSRYLLVWRDQRAAGPMVHLHPAIVTGQRVQLCLTR
jgi:hypothetical protein